MADIPCTRDPLSLVVALRTDLRIEPRDFGEQAYYVIEDPLRAKFFRLGGVEHRFLSLLDGTRDLRQAIGLAARQFGPAALTEDEAVALVHWLQAQQLLRGTQGGLDTSPTEPRRDKSAFARLSGLLAIRIPLGCPDRLLDRVLPWTGWLFTWPAGAVWFAVVGIAAVVAFAHGAEILDATATLFYPETWLGLLATWLVLKLVHEAGHAVACKRFGASVRSAGLSLLLLTPVAYVDVTPAWRLASKWQRIVISAAGMYVEVFLAAVALIVWANTSDLWLKTWARQVFLMAGVQTLLVNANPLLRFDGYYLLADFWEVPNLHAVGQRWWIAATRSWLGDEEPDWPALPSKLSWLVPLHGLAVVCWRAFMYFSIALLILSGSALLGQPLARILTLAWLMLPVVEGIRWIREVAKNLRPNRNRLRITVGGLGAVLLIATVLLFRGARVSAPAVVEYAPLTSIRATVGGFVREIRVENGDEVRAGQSLALLENEELSAGIAEVRRSIRQQEILEQALGARGELAKRTIEAGKREALLVKLHELEVQADALVVRAPRGGRVVARNLAQLAGQYLPAGTEFMILGTEESKELVLAVRQADVELFAAHGSASVAATIAGQAGRYPAELVRLEPSGRRELPHPALSGASGGPVAVIERAPSGTSDSTPRQEALRPVFQGSARLDPAEAKLLKAGQLATVSFVSGQRTVAGQWLAWSQQWLADRMNPRKLVSQASAR